MQTDVAWLEDRIVRLPEVGCWVWMSTLDKDGYARLGGNTEMRNKIVHRVVYSLCVGELVPGHHIDHLCSLRCCVNPRHLEQVTPKENSRRVVARGRHPQASKTHCKYGHNEWRILANGLRECAACNSRVSRELFCKAGHKLFADGDFYVDSRGKRVCRPCRRQRERLDIWSSKPPNPDATSEMDRWVQRPSMLRVADVPAIYWRAHARTTRRTGEAP